MSKTQKTPKNASTWIKHPVPITNFEKGIDYSKGVLMDHYLVISARGNHRDWWKCPTTLVAINLRDYSMQETNINDGWCSSAARGRCTLNRYKDNQIIRYGYEEWSLPDKIDWMTIRSFERIHSRMSISNWTKPLKWAAKKSPWRRRCKIFTKFLQASIKTPYTFMGIS